MTVGANYRSNFDNSTLTSQKYQPLDNLKFPARDAASVADYTQLLATRREVTTTTGLLPASLRLFTEDKHGTVQAEKGHLPPLVVVSAGRSDWIASSLRAINKKQQYGGIGDMDALVGVEDGAVCPVAYHPRRIGANRNVYMVVHDLDFQAYSKALAGTGITVVGWKFVYPAGAPFANLPGPAPANPPPPPLPTVLCGFGASRFAALEFCKALWALVPSPKWSYAWVMDDNVIGVNDCPGLDAVETAMQKQNGKMVAAGFSGATKLDTTADVKSWAKRQKAGGPVIALPKAGNNGILQQAVLWDIEYAVAKGLNFSPLFVTSAEDVSLSLYLDLKNMPYLYYKGLNVIKQEVAKPEVKQGASAPTPALDAARKTLIDYIADQESRGDINAEKPPPATIEPAQVGQGGKQTVLTFITDHYKTPAKNSQAASCAVEQIVCDAIKKNLVLSELLTEIFQVTADREQRVEWF
jgi:hypothetical protein